MRAEESRLNDAVCRLARDEAAALLAEVVESSRREAAEILRTRLTAAMLEAVESLAGSRGDGGRPEHPEPVPAQSGAEPVLPDAEPLSPRADRVAVPAEPLAGWYVYGLTWDAAARSLDVTSGVDDAPVEVVAAGPVAAVVSPMASAGSWGVGADGDVDLELLAPRARRHEWVLEQMLERGAVLPLRFGVLYPSLEPLRRLLSDRRPAFEEALRRLDNHFEWGLTVSAGEAGAPRPLSAVGPASPAGGRDYLARRRADRLAEEERAEEWTRVAACLHETLTGMSADARIHSAAPTGRGQGRVVLRASYLVPAADSEAFRAAAERQLSSAPSHLRLTGELTGPWPAYHFCDLALEGVTA